MAAPCRVSSPGTSASRRRVGLAACRAKYHNKTLSWDTETVNSVHCFCLICRISKWLKNSRTFFRQDLPFLVHVDVRTFKWLRNISCFSNMQENWYQAFVSVVLQILPCFLLKYGNDNLRAFSFLIWVSCWKALPGSLLPCLSLLWSSNPVELVLVWVVSVSV